jgi:hypothetical protein
MMPHEMHLNLGAKGFERDPQDAQRSGSFEQEAIMVRGEPTRAPQKSTSIEKIYKYIYIYI